MDTLKQDTQDTDWLQQWVIPEEEKERLIGWRHTDLHPHPSPYRRFRSSNVIDLVARRKKLRVNADGD
jgi:hypothetical protein